MADYQGENRIRLRGSPAAAPVFSHRNHGTDYYLVPLRVPRLSGNQDVVNLITNRSLDRIDMVGALKSAE